jgi:hypothetical protein
MFYTVILPLILNATLILLPSLWGMRQGLRPTPKPLLQVILWATAAVTTLVARSWLWWPLRNGWQMQLLLLAVYWPVGYLTAAALWKRRAGKSISI